VSILGGIRSALVGTGALNGHASTVRATQTSIARQASRPTDPRDRYAVLWAYYRQTGLYEQLGRALYDVGLWHPALKALRNPAYRIAEAYPAHLWPGDLPDALPIITEHEQIIAPIHQVWQWSNWAQQKQVFARWLAILGDVFVKVATRADATGKVSRCYFELIAPEHVYDWDTDERGNLVLCRIDVPQTRRNDDKLERYTHVEVWSKQEGNYRRWEIPQGQPVEADVARLGTPAETRTLASMGLGTGAGVFVPIVHAKFMDVGEPRGIGAFTLQLDKIDAVNQDATRLAQMLYRHNKPLWATHNPGMDATGRPLPAVRLPGTDNDDGTRTAALGDDDIVELPGTAQLTALVPNLHYEAHRLVNNDGLLDLQQDCPEMAYWRITEHSGGEITGRALRFMLAPFVTRVLEVRGNAEDALARLDMMALTIGQAAGLFSGLGTYEHGDFEHRFGERDVVPVSGYEEAQEAQLRADALQKQLASGAYSVAGALRAADVSDEEIEQMATERASLDTIPVEQ
jgi:hypothetical protein